MGRKSHLFAGSEGGAEHWAILASLIATCKINDVGPQAYLTGVLIRLVNSTGRAASTSSCLDLRRRAHRSRGHGCSLIMAAIWRVYTLDQAAKILGETEGRVSEAGSCMPPEKGCLTIYGPGDAETMGFAEAGLDNARDYLIHMPPGPAT